MASISRLQIKTGIASSYDIGDVYATQAEAPYNIDATCNEASLEDKAQLCLTVVLESDHTHILREKYVVAEFAGFIGESGSVIIHNPEGLQIVNVPLRATATIEFHGEVLAQETTLYEVLDHGRFQNEEIGANTYSSDFYYRPFGGTKGVSIQYRYRNTASGSWSGYTTLATIPSGTTTPQTIPLEISGLQPEQTYQIQIYYITTDNEFTSRTHYIETTAGNSNLLFASKDTGRKAVLPTRWFAKKNGVLQELQGVFLSDNGKAERFFG